MVTVEEMREVVNALARRELRKSASRALHSAEFGEGEFVLHDGDLSLDELRVRGLLVVRGNLTINGLFRGTLEPESAVIVTGDLRAHRLVSEGFLEVLGSVIVEREALWRDSGFTDIHGDLRAALLYTSYHPVRAGGRVIAPLIFGDSNRFESASKFAFVNETAAELAAVLPKAALSLEGDPNGSWWIDHVFDEKLVKLVEDGEPVLQTP